MRSEHFTATAQRTPLTMLNETSLREMKWCDICFQMPIASFEVVVPRRPVSLQASADSRRFWKDYVFGRARVAWVGTPMVDQDVRVTIVYLCDDSPADTDNIIKPIQDALIGCVIADDSLVSDVDCHRRFLSRGIDIAGLPVQLAQAVVDGVEAVYIRVTPSQTLEEYL